MQIQTCNTVISAGWQQDVLPILSVANPITFCQRTLPEDFCSQCYGGLCISLPVCESDADILLQCGLNPPRLQVKCSDLAIW